MPGMPFRAEVRLPGEGVACWAGVAERAVGMAARSPDSVPAILGVSGHLGVAKEIPGQKLHLCNLTCMIYPSGSGTTHPGQVHPAELGWDFSTPSSWVSSERDTRLPKRRKDHATGTCSSSSSAAS